MAVTYYADRVKETTLTTGTGPLVLQGAVTGFMSIEDGMGSGQAWFCCTDGVDWEVFLGYLDGNGDLTRDYCSYSSTYGDFIDWGAGTKEVFNVIPAEAIQYLESTFKERMLTPSIEDNHGYNGMFFPAVAGENVVLGDDCYLKSDGKIWKACSTDIEITAMHIMATGTISAEGSGFFLRTGFIRDDSWSWTPGAILRTSITPGNPIEAYPAAAHSISSCKTIGYAFSADVLFFDPEPGSIAIPAARGVSGGGGISGSWSNVMDYVTIATTGNATDFGDLTIARGYHGACASSTRGLFGGGYTTSAFDTIDYVTIATTGNAVDFGDLTEARQYLAACSNAIRGIWGAGAGFDTIDFVTIATLGNAADFGNVTAARYALGACSSSTRGIFGGGYIATYSAILDFVIFATAGDASVFGDLTVARRVTACSGATRGLFVAGAISAALSYTIDYITLATEGNATDFGDVSVARAYCGACASGIRALIMGGYTTSYSNCIDFVTIATEGNATDFGDLTQARQYVSSLSNGHGGLF